MREYDFIQLQRQLLLLLLPQQAVALPSPAQAQPMSPLARLFLCRDTGAPACQSPSNRSEKLPRPTSPSGVPARPIAARRRRASASARASCAACTSGTPAPLLSLARPRSSAVRRGRTAVRDGSASSSAPPAPMLGTGGAATIRAVCATACRTMQPCDHHFGATNYVATDDRCQKSSLSHMCPAPMHTFWGVGAMARRQPNGQNSQQQPAPVGHA